MTVIIDGGAGVTYPDNVQQSRALTNTGGTPAYYAARAWVLFDGTTTPPTIISSSNITSVVRRSTGLFTITFTNSMPTANYTVAGTAYYNDANRLGVVSQDTVPTETTLYIRTTSISLTSSGASTGYDNMQRVSVTVFA